MEGKMKKIIENLSDQVANKITEKFLKLIEDVLEKIFIAKAVDVVKINVQPGDIIVLKYWRLLRPEAFENLKVVIKPHFPDNEIMILDDGLDVSVITKNKK